MEPERRVVVALGSNLGDRLEHLRAAVNALDACLTAERVSPVYASDPVGVLDQPEFLNAVMVARTALDPWALLRCLHEVEAAQGRRRTRPGGARTLDLDLIFYEDLVIRSDDLQVPHPRWLDRSFVRIPLVTVAPDWIDPVTGSTIAALSSGQPVRGLRPYADPSALEASL